MSKLSKSATFHDFCESPPSSHNDAIRDTEIDHGGVDDDADDDEAEPAPPVRRNYVTKSASATSSFANWLSLFVSKKRTHRSFIRPSMSLCKCFGLPNRSHTVRRRERVVVPPTGALAFGPVLRSFSCCAFRPENGDSPSALVSYRAPRILAVSFCGRECSIGFVTDFGDLFIVTFSVLRARIEHAHTISRCPTSSAVVRILVVFWGLKLCATLSEGDGGQILFGVPLSFQFSALVAFFKWFECSTRGPM